MEKTVDQYILNHPKWQDEIMLLRKILKDCELHKGIKWGAPVFMIEGKNVVGIGAFKSYVGLWFFQGALLDDHYKVLYNAQEGKTQAMRQWRFKVLEEIDFKRVSEYIQEAVNNEKAGRSVKISTKDLIIPSLLKTALDSDDNFASSFDAFTQSKQREFTEYIIEAKREETKQKRLEKIKSMILAGTGLNDKYR